MADKIAIVTGSSSGIGMLTAIELAKNGFKVVASMRDLERRARLDEAASTAQVTGQLDIRRLDVTDFNAIPGFVQQVVGDCGRVDVLINNAGGLVARTRIEDYSEAFLQKVLALNVIHVALFMREVIPVMRRQKKGNVINVSSIAARHGGGAGAIIYAGAKGFISTATHGWAKEVVGDGIRVNAVSPGVITTPFHERYSTPEQLKGMQATIPMNRLGTADECAGTFVYLASDELSGYVTGQVIEVNGGQYMP